MAYNQSAKLLFDPLQQHSGPPDCAQSDWVAPAQVVLCTQTVSGNDLTIGTIVTTRPGSGVAPVLTLTRSSIQVKLLLLRVPGPLTVCGHARRMFATIFKLKCAPPQ